MATQWSGPEELNGGSYQRIDKPVTVRSRFEDTAYWNPFVQTDAAGVAQLSIPLPDNLTTWRATARGVTFDTSTGAATAELLVTKPLLVRLITPRFWTQHDHIHMQVIVQNKHTGTNRFCTTVHGGGGIRRSFFFFFFFFFLAHLCLRRLVEIAHNLPGIIYRCVLRPDGTITYPFVSDDVTHHLGLRPDRLNQPLSFEELTRVLRTDPGGGWHETLERSARTLTPHVVEGSFAAAEGGIRWVRGLGRPHRGQDGAIVWDGVALDITEEKRRELLLREQAETLDTINGINAEIAGELDLERVVRVVTDAVTRLAQGEFAALFYRRADDDRDLPLRYEISGTLKDAFAGMPLGRDTEIFRPTIVGDEVVRLDDVSTDPRYGSDAPFYGIPPGHPSIRSYLSVPVISRSTEIVGTIVLGHRSPGRFDERTEKIVIGIAAQAAIALENARLYQQAQTEIQQRERTQKQQALLLSELDHRVRNTLAVAQSLALSTFAKGEQLETYRNRIRALAHAHGLLAETQWRGANLSTLIEMELAPYKQHDEGERVSITGPEIYLEAETAQTLVLVIHELATNAAKYGALSTSGGRIEVSWDVDNGDRTELHLRWTELSNAKPNVTLHRGFGHQLIERGVEYNLGGNVWLDFGADGFRCEIRVPLSQGGLGGTLPPADDDQSN